MFLFVSHCPDFLITSCIHTFENYVQSILLYGLRLKFTNLRITNHSIILTPTPSPPSQVGKIFNFRKSSKLKAPPYVEIETQFFYIYPVEGRILFQKWRIRNFFLYPHTLLHFRKGRKRKEKKNLSVAANFEDWKPNSPKEKQNNKIFVFLFSSTVARINRPAIGKNEVHHPFWGEGWLRWMGEATPFVKKRTYLPFSWEGGGELEGWGVELHPRTLNRGKSVLKQTQKYLFDAILLLNFWLQQI